MQHQTAIVSVFSGGGDETAAGAARIERGSAGFAQSVAPYLLAAAALIGFADGAVVVAAGGSDAAAVALGVGLCLAVPLAIA